jgi:hypothetical protein
MRIHDRLILAVVLCGTFLQSSAQSGREYRRSAVMRGNLVKTVFGNWGVVGQPAEKGARGAWIYETNGYIGDVSPLVGAEVNWNGKTFHSVVTCPVSRPSKQHELSPSGKPWGFEPVAGYFNEAAEGVALFTDPSSWPPFWPDKQTDLLDPGWPGSWDGFFGKTTTASEETYFVMDDANDEEFNFAENNQWKAAFKPDSLDPNRSGLGLSVKVRGMQWSDFLAQDCIFWLYEIKNAGTSDYTKAVFGMLAGTYVGVTSTEDYHEYDDDYSFFDVGQDLTYTGDFPGDNSRNPRWVGPVGIVGYAFLESPGNGFDGIDNDGDAGSNPGFPSTAPLFTEEDFQPRILNAGDKVVLIDKKYNRTVETVPDRETDFVTRGATIHVIPGVTGLVEGNLLPQAGQENVNPNAYDGVDNDLDGLIDENYTLHYHQIRRDSKGNLLIDRFTPVRHKDYAGGAGLGDPMIDERRDDGIDNDGDWNPQFDDVGADGVPGTNDYGEGDGRPTPGEPNFDQTDVDESDQIGLTSFEYFAPANNFSMADDEDLWRRLSPGYFAVPSSIMNNKPTRGEDGDFIYGSGFFPLRSGGTERFSLALVYGEGGGPNMILDDLLKNKETVQKIYDSDYRFPPPPEKPTLTVSAGDHKVTLYWDRLAEQSVDPVLHVADFEGYKIYRATDQNFNDAFGITDANGTPVGYKPIAQFDLKNGVTGYFRAGSGLYQDSRGASFYLGKDTGLRHSFVDTDVENGRRYFYAVVAYDRGDAENDIFPKENDKRIDVLPSGEVRTFRNTAAVTPNAETAGYVPPPSGSVPVPPVASVGTGRVFYRVIDETVLTGHAYRLEFWDTSDDGLDNNNNGLIDGPDTLETMVPVTTSYSVLDLTGASESFVSGDTVAVRLSRNRLDPASVTVLDEAGNSVPPERYALDAAGGRIRGKAPGDLDRGAMFTVFYRYYPVFKSPHIEGSPYADETLDTDIFDGVRLSFNNTWKSVVDTLRSGWKDPSRAYSFDMSAVDTYIGEEERHMLGVRHPGDYFFIFSNGVSDTSLAQPDLFLPAVPVNFRIYNATDRRFLRFAYNNQAMNGKLSPFDEIVLLEPGPGGKMVFTWDFQFTQRRDSIYDYHSGDTLKIFMKKPFRRGDVFEFTAVQPTVDRKAESAGLDRIRVVPNPYVAATTHELPLPPAVTSGRGERKVDFIHLPAGATIHVFTSRGEKVVTLRHEGNIHDGTVSWDLKTSENLDIAAGVYFYVVESGAGIKRGKIAIIK